MANNKDLKFVIKQRGHKHTNLDVDLSITLINKGNAAALSFSQKAFTILGGEFVIAAKLGSRIFFKPADERHGFKLCGRKAGSRSMVRIPAKQIGITPDWIGYYNLLWDRERELFYIANDHELKFKEATK